MLTPLELDIMKAVWELTPVTVKDVQAAIRPRRKLAYTTVMTLMYRLFHKGFLTRKTQSRAHVYEPAVGYMDVRDAEVDRLIQNFFSGSRQDLRNFLGGESQDRRDVQREEPSGNVELDETLL